MDDRTAVTAGALIGAVVGAAASYLFFTGRGRELRDRIQPAIDDLQREFGRFQGTIEQVGRMAERRCARGAGVQLGASIAVSRQWNVALTDQSW